ncbi:MAG: hypothetical protein SFX73_05170 [Kofleriaceae bacterium]|nr:hypothetical protein [Kofleriaceae bacterium]
MPRHLSRRDLLHAMGLGATALPLLACNASDGGGGQPDAPPTADAQPDATCATTWASGGTAAMTAKTSYPDPFATAVATCPLVLCRTTAGPCTAPTTERVDVSEGNPGLPVRLAVKLVTHTTCAPIAGAIVEIWHTHAKGVYSGQTPSPGFCSGGDAEAPTKNYFRGTQTSDANGVVTFDTCFPGWYPGRAIHIHFSVRIGGDVYLVSQLFFAQPLIDEIFSCHPDYVAYGAPDTPNANDGVVANGNVAPYLVETARMPDGAMLASKVIAIRGAGDVNCVA